MRKDRDTLDIEKGAPLSQSGLRQIGAIATLPLALLSFLCCGCSATASLEETQLLAQPLSDFRSVELHVAHATEEDPDASDAERTRAVVARKRFQTLLVVAIREQDVFREVNLAGSPRPATHRLDVRIERVFDPGTFWQTILGFLSPRTSVTVTGKWSEGAGSDGAGETLGAFEATGSSARGSVYSGGFEQAAIACASRIAVYASRRR